MAEGYIKTLRAVFHPTALKIAAGIVSVAGAYDIFSNQFDLPKLGRLLGMSGSLLPWWGWLLALQSALVIGLFEFVRRRIPATATNADNESGAFGFAESVPSIESAEERFHAIEAAIRGLTNRDANKNQDAKIEQLRSFAMSAHTDLKKVLAIAEAVCASSVYESVIQTTRKVPIPFSDADEDKIQNFITACEFALIRLGRNDAYRNLMKNVATAADTEFEAAPPQAFTPTYRKQEIARRQAQALLEYFISQKRAIDEFLRENAQIVSKMTKECFERTL